MGGEVIPKINSEPFSSQSHKLGCHRSGEVPRYWVKQPAGPNETSQCAIDKNAKEDHPCKHGVPPYFTYKDACPIYGQLGGMP
jgi:hypothetical protein